MHSNHSNNKSHTDIEILANVAILAERRTFYNLLYINADDRNWDDWFKDEPLTVDMQIVYPIHWLPEYTVFSIFDILWVRDFNIELCTEMDYGTDVCRDDEEPNFDLLDY